MKMVLIHHFTERELLTNSFFLFSLTKERGILMKDIPLIEDFHNILNAYELISNHLNYNTPEELVNEFFEFEETFDCPTFRGFNSDKLISKNELIVGHSSFSFSLVTAKDFTRLMENEGQLSYLIKASHLRGINVQRLFDWVLESATALQSKSTDKLVVRQLENIINDLTYGELHFFSLEEEVVATNTCFRVDHVVEEDDIFILSVRG